MHTHVTTTGSLDIAQELCDVCLGPCVYETERRCVACDRPVCPSCMGVTGDRVETRCPECRKNRH